MGTSTEVCRLMPDGRVRMLHLSNDGYLSGVGLTLHLLFQDEAEVEWLFSKTNYLHSLAGAGSREDIGFMSDWHDDYSYSMEDFIKRHTYPERDYEWLGIYFYAAGKWIYPSKIEDVADLIATGESPYALTREFLVEQSPDLLNVRHYDPFNPPPRPPRLTHMEEGELYANRVEGQDGFSVVRAVDYIEVTEIQGQSFSVYVWTPHAVSSQHGSLP